MNTTQELIEKRKYLENLRPIYESNGTVTWEEFYSDPITHQKKVVQVYNSDFSKGTLRVQYPCMIKLMENISFNPNRPNFWIESGNTLTNDFSKATGINPSRTFDWFPTLEVDGNEQYFEDEVKFAYGLGFFAALAIEGENILINLNNYTLEQHEEHALQQRFYAHIELADQPFIPFQGPSNFGAKLRAARNVYIHNGKLGRSSHHGIHGNLADGVFIDDIEFEDFEVSSFALNGSKNVYVDKLSVIKNRQDIPVLAPYAQGRFIRLFIAKVKELGYNTPELDAYELTLNQTLDQAFNSVIFNKGQIPILYRNNTKLIDGNPYGMLINPKGIAVNGFMGGRNNAKSVETSNIFINNCSINNIHGNVNEIVAIGNGSGKAQVDTAGAVLQFFNGISNKVNGKWYYKGTYLSNVQIELAKIKHSLEEQDISTSFLGTLNITPAIVEWKEDPEIYFIKTNDSKLKMMKNNNPYFIDGEEVVYEIFCNGDSMFHVNKGTIGLRLEGANSAIINNLNISNISNIGNQGSTLKNGYVSSHPASNNMVGYHGNNTYGMISCAINDVEFNNINIDNIESETGSATGSAYVFESMNFNIENMTIKNIKSSVNNKFNLNRQELPNKRPISKALFIDHTCKNININNLDYSNIENNSYNPFNKELDINTNIKLS